MRVRGESSVRRGKFLGVVLDTRPRDDRDVLQDLQGGSASEGGTEPCLQQYRPK